MFIFHNFSPWQVIKRVSPFHASHKTRVFRECENKNMKIFTSVASTSKSRYYKEGNVQSKKCQAIRR